MGISRLKRLLSEALTRAFNTNQIQLFGRVVYPNLDLYELTGYPKNCTIPRKDAADELVSFFFDINKYPQFIELIIKTEHSGFKGEPVVIHNLKQIFKEVEECGFTYDTKLGKLLKKESNEKRNDWGFLEEGKVYNFCFASIDICGNSKLVRKYDGAKVKETYKYFKNMVVKAVENRNGRIWSWEGDGGLLVFHLNDSVNDAVFTSIEIMSSLLLMNSSLNLLGEDIVVRVGINAGDAEYKKDTQSIISDSIEIAKNIEKNHTIPSTISLSKNSFQHINSVIRGSFTEKEVNGLGVYQLELPIRSTN